MVEKEGGGRGRRGSNGIELGEREVGTWACMVEEEGGGRGRRNRVEEWAVQY